MRKQLTSIDMNIMNIGSKYWDVSLSKIKETTHKAVVSRYALKIEYVRSKGIGLYLCGDNRSGKTSIAVAILKEARRQKYTCYFITAVELRDAYYDKTMFEEDVTVIQRCIGVDFLVIDDFGKELTKSQHGERKLEDLIRQRCNNLRPTILTTNVNPNIRKDETKSDLEKEYPRSLTELIKGCMHTVIVKDDWRSAERSDCQSFIMMEENNV